MITRKAFIEAFGKLDTGNVTIDLFDKDGTVHVGYIMQNQAYRQGEASKQMRRLCALADRAGITLSLYVDPGSRANPPMSKIELLKWYRRLGFESTPGRIFYMERKPKMKIEAAQRLAATKQLRILRKNPPKPYFVLRYLQAGDEAKATGRIYSTMDKDHLVGVAEADKFKTRDMAKKFLDQMADYDNNAYYIEQIT